MISTIGMVIGVLALLIYGVMAFITHRYEKTHSKRQPAAVIGHIDKMEMQPEGLFVQGRWRDGPPERLTWAVWPWHRCQYFYYKKGEPFHGRCELVKHDEETDHALERGFDIVRWSHER